MTRSLTVAPSGFDVVVAGSVVDRPITIFDLQGIELFYDFPIESDEAVVGTIRVAANKLLGHPWVSIQDEKELMLQEIEADARAMIASILPGSTINDVILVCFNYPRLGLLFTISDNAGTQIRRIYDLSVTPPVLIEIFEAGGDNIEGESMYSLLESLPEGSVDGQPKEFDEIDEVINEVFKEACEKCHLLPDVPKHSLSPDNQKEALRWTTANQPEGLPTNQKVIDIENLRQERGTYCVLACIEMLLRHHDLGMPDSQNDIREVLNQDPSLYIENRGVLPEKQVEAFSRCFGVGTQVVIDETPTWDEAVIEIDNDRPFKSGILGHARVCIGYHETVIGPAAAGTQVLHRSYWINDPGSRRKLELHETAELTSIDPLVISNAAPKIPLKTNHVLIRRGVG